MQTPNVQTPTDRDNALARLRQLAAERTPATPAHVAAGYEDHDAWQYIEDPFGVAETSAELSAGLLADGYGEDDGSMVEPPEPPAVAPADALATLRGLGRASAALVARALDAALPAVVAALGELLDDGDVLFDPKSGTWATESAPDDEERDTSTAWSYRVPYCDSIHHAFNGLRWELFERGLYRGPKGLRSVYALRRAQGDDGTHSILDMDWLASTPGERVVSPVSGDEILEAFGTTKPTWEQVEAAGLPLCPAWQGRYVTLYRDGRPREVVFFGRSGR